MSEADFYLASSEGYGLDHPRKCWRVRRLSTAKRNDLLLIRIQPPLAGQKYGLGDRDIELVLIAARHQGQTLFPVSEWPSFVHVARLLIEDVGDLDRICEDQFELIGWAEIYKTEEDARLKRT